MEELPVRFSLKLEGVEVKRLKKLLLHLPTWPYPSFHSSLSGMFLTSLRREPVERVSISTGLEGDVRRSNAVPARSFEVKRRISTGSTALDGLLGGGVAVGRLTEFFGPSGSGKSQVLFSLVVGCIGAGGRALFVDTQGSFRPERVHQIAASRGLDPEVARRGLDVTSVRSTEKLAMNVELAVERDEYRYIFLDTLSDLFYGEYEVRRDLARLSLFCRRLSFLALRRDLLIAVSDGVRYNPLLNVVASLGYEYVAPYIHHRISLSRNGGEWMALNPDTGERAFFRITSGGTVDS